MDAAADLFDKKGYQNTTMQDLAEVLGIAKPTLYTRIGSKLELLERIFQRVVEVGSRQLDIGSGVAPEIRIPEILRGWTYSAVRLRSHYSVFYSDERELPPGLVKQFRQWSADNVEFPQEPHQGGAGSARAPSGPRAYHCRVRHHRHRELDGALVR